MIVLRVLAILCLVGTLVGVALAAEAAEKIGASVGAAVLGPLVSGIGLVAVLLALAEILRLLLILDRRTRDLEKPNVE